MLRRFGNKSKMAQYLAPMFPQHTMRIELFFGAGGAYFNLPRPKYAVLNDIDDDVFNLYMVVRTRKEEFVSAVKQLPISSSLLTHWKTNQETDPLYKAIRFVLVSNFTVHGKGFTLRLGQENAKKRILESIDLVFEYINEAQITCYDFREVIPKIQFSDRYDKKQSAFVYMDPVYLETEHTYRCPKWTEDDTADCMDIILNCGIKSAMSEFDHPRVLGMAKERNLKVYPIKNRRNINKRSNEILITNYLPNYQLFEQ